AAEKSRRVIETTHWLRLNGLELSFPSQLSGGQQQRVALARAVVRRPRLLMLDEPLAALDAPLRVRLRGELRRLLCESAIPTLLVTHDRAEALAMGDRLVVLQAGQILQQGPIDTVFNHPANASVAATLGIETVQPGRIIDSDDGMAIVEV